MNHTVHTMVLTPDACPSGHGAFDLPAELAGHAGLGDGGFSFFNVLVVLALLVHLVLLVVFLFFFSLFLQAIQG
jgi:hypothetical protein